MGVDYDTSEPIWRIAMTVANTIIPMVIQGSEFWFFLIINVFVMTMRKLEYFNPEDYHVKLEFGLTGITGGLMTFFVCFYNSHVFARYNTLYRVTQEMCEDVIQTASMLRIQLEDERLMRKVMKLVLASCFMFFFERSSGRQDGANGSVVSRKEWYQLWQLDLLEEMEIRSLRQHCRRLGPDALPSFVLLCWAMQILRGFTDSPNDREDMLSAFYSRLSHVRRCQSLVVQAMELPMPFQYFHIMNMMLIINLSLWAYSLGCQDSYFAPLIFMFVQIMFQGVRELSTALSDPFGDDDVDFPVNEWMKTLYWRVYGILEDTFDIDSCNAPTALISPEKVREALFRDTAKE